MGRELNAETVGPCGGQTFRVAFVLACMSAIRAMVSVTSYEALHARQLLVSFVPILLIGFLSVALPRWTKRALVPRGSLEVLLGCHAVAFVLDCFDPRNGLLLHALAALVASAVVAYHAIAARAYGAAYVAALVLVHATAGTIVAGATEPDQAWLRICLAAVVLLCLELGHRIARALIGAANERHGMAPLKPETSALVQGQRLSAVATLALWSLGLPCALPACIAGSLGFIRMFLLQPWRVHPIAGIAAVLAGVIWLNIGFLGLAILPTTGYLMPEVAIIHMWSVGGLGTTATAVMTSITRKRNRTSFRPALLANLAYASIGFSAGMRLLAFAMVESSQAVLLAVRLGWISAFSCCLVFVGIGSRDGTWRAVIGRAGRLWKAAAGSPHAPACIPNRDASGQPCLPAAAIRLNERPDSCVACGSILPNPHGGWTVNSPFEADTGCGFALDQSRWEKVCQHAQHHGGFPMGLMTTLIRWRSSRQAGQELTSLDAGELAALARDVGLSPDQLIRVTARGARAGEELPRLLDASGLAPQWLEHTRPDVMRDMSIICTGCSIAKRCRRDLNRGWARPVQRYCPSIGTIDALLAERSRAFSSGRPWSVRWP